MSVIENSLRGGMDMSTSRVFLGCFIFSMFQMPISTEISEAANSNSLLITHRATSTNVTVMVPPDSRCNGRFKLCTKESELCSEPDMDKETDHAFIFKHLQSNTSYILKSDNETLRNCQAEVHTCPDELPMVTDYSMQSRSHGFQVTWSPPPDQCKSDLVYFLRYKFNDLEYTQWRDAKTMSENSHGDCRSNTCVCIDEEQHRTHFTLQVRVRRAGEERFGEHTEQTWGSAHEAKHAQEPFPYSEPAWQGGLWAALGGTACLAFITVLGVCYFDRAKLRNEQLSPTVTNSDAPPCNQVCIKDVLVPDLEALVNYEIVPKHTPPPVEIATLP